jgi:hypothetical protein
MVSLRWGILKKEIININKETVTRKMIQLRTGAEKLIK